MLDITQTQKLTGILILFVIIILVLAWKLNYLDITYSRFENIQEVNNEAVINIMNQNATTNLLVNNLVKFYGTDEYHTFHIKLPTNYNINNINEIEIRLANTNSMEPDKVIKLTKPFTIGNNNIIATQFKLMENSNYQLAILYNGIEITPETSRYTKYFETDYNTFYFGSNQDLNKLEKQQDADNAGVLGISVNNINWKWGGDINDNLVPPTNASNVKYYIKKPAFQQYTQTIIAGLSGTPEYIDVRNQLSKYIPYEFDGEIISNRTNDSMPDEVFSLPQINCDITGSCIAQISNLRANTLYTVRLRMKYVRLDSKNNYRSTPWLTWKFQTGNINNSIYGTLDQIRDLIKNIKDTSINMTEFNKSQNMQNAKLTSLESLANQKIGSALDILNAGITK